MFLFHDLDLLWFAINKKYETQTDKIRHPVSVCPASFVHELGLLGSEQIKVSLSHETKTFIAVLTSHLWKFKLYEMNIRRQIVWDLSTFYFFVSYYLNRFFLFYELYKIVFSVDVVKKITLITHNNIFSWRVIQFIILIIQAFLIFCLSQEKLEMED